MIKERSDKNMNVKHLNISSELGNCKSIIDILKMRARTQPKDVAYSFLAYSDYKRSEINLTYMELDKRARKIATYLQKHNMEGERAILLYPDMNEIDFISAFYGCIYAKVIAIPFCYSASEKDTEKLLSSIEIIRDSRAKVFLTIDSNTQNLKKFTIESLEQDMCLFATDKIEGIDENDFCESSISIDELAYLQYTSGSTSSPKGVMITHKNILHNLKVIQWHVNNDAESVGVSWITLYHDMGLIFSVIQPVYFGYKQYLMQPNDFVSKPYRFLKALSDYKGTFLSMPNFAFNHCVNLISKDNIKNLDLSCVKTIVNLSEPVDCTTVNLFNEKFKDCGLKEDAICTCYGLAEAVLVVSMSSLYGNNTGIGAINVNKEKFANNLVEIDNNRETSIKCCSSGVMCDEIKIKIVNPKTLEECSSKEVGEVWVASPSIARGYWEKPEVNKEAFNAHISNTKEGPFLRTGDLGFIHENRLYISGRIKDVIIIRGINYYPSDIEYTIEHSKLASVIGRCASFTISENYSEELYIVAEIKPSKYKNEYIDEIYETVREMITKIHGLQVKGILLVDYGGIPKTVSGKIQRSLCKKNYLNNRLSIIFSSILNQKNELFNQFHKGDESSNSNTLIEEIQKKLCSILAKILKINKESIEKSKKMITLGMDSISLTMFKSIIEDEFQKSIDMTFLFECTLENLAQEIAAKSSNKIENSELQNSMLEINVDKRNWYNEFSLTDLQNAYWMGRNKEFELGGVSPHMYIEVKASGDLDNYLLNKAWQKLIDRHFMLRVVIMKDGQQKILDKGTEYKIKYHDLTKSTKEEKNNECNNIREKFKNHFVELDTWPWFEIHHTKLSNMESILHIYVDLMIADIWSINTLLREWYKLYNDINYEFVPIEVSFRDYCIQLEKRKYTEKYNAAEQYWKKRISSLPEAPKLPIIKNPKELISINTVHHSYVLPEELSQSLKDRAVSNGVTTSIVLMAVFSKVLNMWCQSPKFSLNLTLFNRLGLNSNINNVIGDFTSVSILEVNNNRDQNFSEFSRCMQQQLAQDLQNRDYNGVNVLRDLATYLGKNPKEAILPIVFTSALSNNETMVFESEKDFFGKCTTITQTPQVYLDCQTYESENSLILIWDSIDELFPKNLIEDMFEAYKSLVYELATSDEFWKSKVKNHLLDRQLQKRLKYNNTKFEESADFIYSGFIRNAENDPNNIAVITLNRSITYKQLLNTASYVANHIKNKGIKANDIVPVMMNKGWEQVVAVLGITMAGAAYVCIDPGLPKERKDYLLEHCQSKLVVTQADHISDLDTVYFIIDENILIEDENSVVLSNNPNDLAYIIYTSGSTGKPKGVAISHKSAVNTIVDINNKFKVTSKDRVLALAALSFDLSVYDIFGILAAGGTVVMPNPFNERNPDHWIEMIEKYHVTVWNSVPSLFEMMVENLETLGRKIELRLVMLSGDWIPVNLPERFWKINQTAKIISLGGATEASIWSIYYPIKYIDSTWKSIPYGTPLQNQTIYVLNENLENCPDWVTGDIYIGGNGLAKEYYRDKSKTEEAFIINPETGERIYKTGDLGRFNSDGYVEFLGRSDFQVKVGGFRIELGEIETVLNNHRKIQRAVVNKIVNEEGNISLAAYMVLNSNEKLDKEKNEYYDYKSEIVSSDGSELILDSYERLLYKLKNPGLRIQESDTKWKELQNNMIYLENNKNTKNYTERISTRKFIDKKLSFSEFSEFLSTLKKIDIEGMKRFMYGSAGGIYPVQTYIYVKPKKIEGVEEGIYYYQPFENVLILITKNGDLGESLHVEGNKQIYNSSAFTIFLVGKLSAIKPLYGDKSRDFCLIEAGLIAQLMEINGIKLDIGTCQIGMLANEKKVNDLLELDEEYELLHVILAGKNNPSDLSRGLINQHNNGDKSEFSDITNELKKYCAAKLPYYMIPTNFTVLEEIPLTSVGKVDYKALPIPNIKNKEITVNDFSNDMEAMVYKIFKEKSGIGELDINKSFFDMGINSLTITRAWREIVKQTGIDFPVVRIFEEPTITDLSSYLAKIGEFNNNDDEEIKIINDRVEKQRSARAHRVRINSK